MAKIVITLTDNPAGSDVAVNIATEFDQVIDISKLEDLTEAQKAAVAMLGDFLEKAENVQLRRVSA